MTSRRQDYSSGNSGNGNGGRQRGRGKRTYDETDDHDDYDDDYNDDYDDDYDYDDYNDGRAGGGRQQQPPRQRRRRVRAVGRRNRGGRDGRGGRGGRAGRSNNNRSNRSEMEMWLSRNERSNLAELNAQLERGLERCHREGGDVEAVQNEYRLGVAEVERRFGTRVGHVVAFGSNEGSQLGLVENIGAEVDDNCHPPKPVRFLQRKNIRQVASGGFHSAALAVDGQAFTWGTSDEGCLGRPVPASADDTEQLEATPTAVTLFASSRDDCIDGGKDETHAIREIGAGNMHTVFLTRAGRVYQCGTYKDNDSGLFCDLEEPATSTPEGCNEVPVPVRYFDRKNRRAVRIWTGQDSGYNAALLADSGTLVTWGFGNFGELGRSADMVPADMTKPGGYDVSRDCYFDGSVDRKGNKILNLERLRDAFLTPAPVRWAGFSALSSAMKPTVLSVACGMHHLVVAARDPGQFRASVYSCGLNSFGQLGNGYAVSKKESDENPSLPFMVHELTKIKALEGENITEVAAGELHSLARTHDGIRVFGWGKSDEGQLGLGYAKAEQGSHPLPQIIDFPSGDGGHGVVQQIIKTSISAGAKQSFAITADGDLYSWGLGDDSWAAGHPTTEKRHVYRPTKLDLLPSISQGAAARGSNNRRSFKAVRTLQAAGGSMSSLVLVQPEGE